MKQKLIALAVLSTLSLPTFAINYQFTSGSHTISDNVNAIVQIGDGETGTLHAIRVQGDNTNVIMNGESIDVEVIVDRSYDDSWPSVSGITTTNSGNLTLGSENTNSIVVNVDVNGTGVSNETEYGLVASGIWATNSHNDPKSVNGGLITVNANNLEINVHSEQGWSYGLYSQNRSVDSSKEKSRLVINADNTVIRATSGVKGQSHAIVLMSEGEMEINGNLYASADYAITARGNSKLTINESSDKIVQLIGDINFNYDKATSGTIVDSDVRINLSGTQSYWEGSAITSYGSGEPEDGTLRVTGLELGISDGARWTPTLVEEESSTESGIEQIAINKVSLDNGIINLINLNQSVDIENIEGNGSINVATQLNEDGTFNTSKLNIGNGESTLNVNYTGINADQISNAEEAFQSLESAIQSEVAVVSQIQHIAEGEVNGALTNEGGTITQAKNTKLDAFGSVAALNAVSWRHELNSVSKRMGELRDAPEGVGAWARLYGSEMEYGDQNVKAKNTTIQIGSDYKIGQWTVGATVGYTDGDSDYDRGSSDNEAWNFGVYGTWFADNGQYVDLIAKYSRLSQDFKLDTMTGDYDNNAFVVSAEYGWHLPVMELGFIEPQVELTYGRIMGEDFTTGNSVRIEQDDFDSFIGRLGVRAGIKCPDNWGTIYARASVVHDFDGEFNAKARSLTTSATADIFEDLGGTWGEFGIGANINFTKNTYMYVDAEITSGGEVDENYRWNIGVRHNF